MFGRSVETEVSTKALFTAKIMFTCNYRHALGASTPQNNGPANCNEVRDDQVEI